MIYPDFRKRIRPIKLLTPEELPIENWPKTRILPASYGNRLMTDFSVIGRESVKGLLHLEKRPRMCRDFGED